MTAPAARRTGCGGEHCCERAGQLWDADEILVAAVEHRPLPTAVIDALPPWRARLLVGVLFRCGATLEHGTEASFMLAAADAERAGTERGWWRAALGLPPDGPVPHGGKGRNMPAH